MSKGIVHGSIKTWRYWQIAKHRGLFVLESSMQGKLWLPGHKTTAKGRLSLWNKCGLYAYKDRRTAEGQGYYYAGCVLGKVALWGEVFEHEAGFRAGCGRPLELHAAICAACKRFIPLYEGVLVRRGIWGLASCFPNLKIGTKTILSSGWEMSFMALGLLTIYFAGLAQLLYMLLNATDYFSIGVLLAVLLTSLVFLGLLDMRSIEMGPIHLIGRGLKLPQNLFMWNKYAVICKRHLGNRTQGNDLLLALSARYYFPLDSSTVKTN